MNWFQKLLNNSREPRKYREDSDSREVISSLPTLDKLNWRINRDVLVREVDPAWLVNRLAEYQGCFPKLEEKYANKSALVGDLFEAGFETENLAWMWGESDYFQLQGALEEALEEIGVTLLSDENCMAIRQCESLRLIVSGEEGLESFWMLNYKWIAESDYETNSDLIYYLDAFDYRGGHKKGVAFCQYILPHMEARYDSIIEDARKCLED